MVSGEREGGQEFPCTVRDDASAVISFAEKIQSLTGEERRQVLETFLRWMNWEYGRLLEEADSNEGFVEAKGSNGRLKTKDLNPNTRLSVSHTPKGYLGSMQITQKLDDKHNTLLFDVGLYDKYRFDRNRIASIYATSKGPVVVLGSRLYSERSMRLSFIGDSATRLEFEENRKKITLISLAPSETPA